MKPKPFLGTSRYTISSLSGCYILCELGQVKWWGKVNIEIGQFSSTRKRELKRCRLRRCDIYTESGLLQYIFPISDNFVNKRYSSGRWRQDMSQEPCYQVVIIIR